MPPTTNKYHIFWKRAADMPPGPTVAGNLWPQDIKWPVWPELNSPRLLSREGPAAIRRMVEALHLGSGTIRAEDQTTVSTGDRNPTLASLGTQRRTHEVPLG